MVAHSGLAAPQSAQKLLLGSTQIRSATSRFDKASPIALRMASTHCSRSCSVSAMKLWSEANTWHNINVNIICQHKLQNHQKMRKPVFVLWVCWRDWFPLSSWDHWGAMTLTLLNIFETVTGNYTNIQCMHIQTDWHRLTYWVSMLPSLHLNTNTSQTTSDINGHLDWFTHWHTIFLPSFHILDFPSCQADSDLRYVENINSFLR